MSLKSAIKMNLTCHHSEIQAVQAIVQGASITNTNVQFPLYLVDKLTNLL